MATRTVDPPAVKEARRLTAVMVLLGAVVLIPCLTGVCKLIVGNVDEAFLLFMIGLAGAVPVGIGVSFVWEDWVDACAMADRLEWEDYQEQQEKERLEREELLRWVEKNYQTTKEDE